MTKNNWPVFLLSTDLWEKNLRSNSLKKIINVISLLKESDRDLLRLALLITYYSEANAGRNGIKKEKAFGVYKKFKPVATFPEMKKFIIQRLNETFKPAFNRV